MGYKLRTVKDRDVAKELRVPFIHHGYRLAYQPWSYYFKSLFHVHNETVNVWSHYLGCVIISYQMYKYYGIYEQHNSELRWTVVSFGLCCLTTLFNSATAHLLHSRSAYVNYLIFMFDYIGVVHWGFGTSILAVYGVSDPSTYHWIGSSFVFIQSVWTYISFISICLSKLWFGHDLSNKNRKLMIVVCIMAQAVTNIIPWFPRYSKCYSSPDCDLSSLNHITIVCISFILMTLAFVLHQPEKVYPSRFDIVGQSHQIFHVIVIITQTLQFRALYIDFQNRTNVHCKPDPNTLLSYILIIQVASIATIALSRGRVKRIIAQNTSKHS